MAKRESEREVNASGQTKKKPSPDWNARVLLEYRVAAIQAAPVFLNKEATIEKACRLIEEAASGGAALAVFPETWVPGYPYWLATPGVVRQGQRASGSSLSSVTRKIFNRLYTNSVDIPGPETQRLGEAAKKAGIFIVMGVHERTLSGTLYNTILFLGKDGNLLGKHRKLVPTGNERTVWGYGDGSTLRVFDTEIGRLSGLICWENWMPLARYALYSQGEQVHIAVWPSMTDGFLLASRAVGHEGRVFVVAAASYLRRDMLPPDLEFANEMDLPEVCARGGSAIISPDGTCLAGPIYDQETILYANINLEKTLEGKQSLDVVGHYARSEVFKLYVDRREMNPVIFEEPTQNTLLHVERFFGTGT